MKQRKKKTHPIRAKKSLGQNFLKNYGIVRKIVETAEIQKGETVLEIGPGRGVLTQALLEAGARVIAVEKDRELIPILEETFHEQIKLGLLTVCHEDILTFDLARCEKTYKVVANIPYYITGQIIRMLLSASNQPKTLIMMAQKEVAKRIVAIDKKESLLSLSVKAYGTPHYVMTVSRGSFSPAPNVDSAILLIDKISREFFIQFTEKAFFDLIHAGFISKRKKLISNLSDIYQKDLLAQLFKTLTIPETIRAEDITLDQWKSLLTKVHNSH